MEEQFYYTRYASVIYRQCCRFYDKMLEPYHIGSGQHFFLLKIYENQGMSMYELAHMGHFDKGTVTRAVQKMEEQGYIRVEQDEVDRRVRRLYTTKRAKPVIDYIYKVRHQWNLILTEGLSGEECAVLNRLLHRMADSAWNYIEGNDLGSAD